MILAKKVRIITGSIFLLLAIVLAVYFLCLISNWRIADATIILALLTAVLSLAISLFNNVKLRKTWKR